MYWVKALVGDSGYLEALCLFPFYWGESLMEVKPNPKSLICHVSIQQSVKIPRISTKPDHSVLMSTHGFGYFSFVIQALPCLLNFSKKTISFKKSLILS